MKTDIPLEFLWNCVRSPFDPWRSNHPTPKPIERCKK